MEWLLALVLALALGLGGWTWFRPRPRIPTRPRGPAYWVPCFPSPEYLPDPADPDALPRIILSIATEAARGPLGRIPVAQDRNLLHEILHLALALYAREAERIQRAMGPPAHPPSVLTESLVKGLGERGPAFRAEHAAMEAQPADIAERLGLGDAPEARQHLDRLERLLGYVVRDALEHGALYGGRRPRPPVGAGAQKG